MRQFDFIHSQITKTEAEYSVYSCPMCGMDNRINSAECRYCRYDLKEHEALLFSRWNKYGEALSCAKNAQFLSALESIVQFLEYYPKDVEALRLKLYILYKLNDNDLESKIEDYIRKESDRWADRLLDAPDKIMLDDFQLKDEYKGTPIDSPAFVNIGVKQQENFNNARSLIEIINALYNMRCRRKKASKLHDNGEFDFFYDNVFLVYLARREIRVVDYLGIDFSKLTDEEKKYLGSIAEIKDKKQADGLVEKVYQPEIRYHTFIIQKAKIAVINNKQKSEKEKPKREEGKLND